MLIREGARVVLGDVLDEQGEATVRALGGAEGSALYRHADVLVEDQCQALMADAVAAYGRLDGLVNNVGWYPRATLEETTGELWDRVLALNLRSAFYCCKHAVGPLRAAGGGSIVNMGSFNAALGRGSPGDRHAPQCGRRGVEPPAPRGWARYRVRGLCC
jgi:NAD(P)-dependent dehydrogenase (short-subunit alcohol dehydrogenase family)